MADDRLTTGPGVAGSSTEPLAPPPETKDWTFVIEQPCVQCGFDPAGVDVHEGFTQRVLAAAGVLADAAVTPGAGERPAPLVWSPLEYAAHVRDVLTVFAGRVELMRVEDGAQFDNWDQDAAAIEGRYWEQAPEELHAGLTAGAQAVTAQFAALSDAEWGHRGLRSNGSAFTTATLASYFLHDLEHHVHDVTSTAA